MDPQEAGPWPQFPDEPVLGSVMPDRSRFIPREPAGMAEAGSFAPFRSHQGGEVLPRNTRWSHSWQTYNLIYGKLVTSLLT